MFHTIEDILQYFDAEEEEEYNTNQAMVRMQHLFRGHTVKSWKGVDFSTQKYHRLNKVLIKHSMLHCKQGWEH